MKKSFLTIILCIVIIFGLTGCGEDDYNDYVKQVGDGISCTYVPYDENDDLSDDLYSIKIDATKEEVDFTYTGPFGPTTNNYLKFTFKKDGKIKGKDGPHNDHKLTNGVTGDTEIFIKLHGFTPENFFNLYKQHNRCPENIFINKEDYVTISIYETKYEQGYGEKYVTYKVDKNAEGTTGETFVNPDCGNQAAVSCIKYQKNIPIDKDITVEFGFINTDGTVDKYFGVYNEKESLFGYRYGNDHDVFAGKLGSYSYYVADNDWSLLFPGENKVVSEDDLVLLVKSINNVPTIMITVKNSPTIDELSEYKDVFGSPTSTTLPLYIKNINLCATGSGTLKVMQIVGYLIYLVKIVVPLILIILATVEFAKGVINSSEKPNKEVLVGLAKKIVAAVIIFLIPTILNLILGQVEGVVEVSDNGEYVSCSACLFDPFNGCE